MLRIIPQPRNCVAVVVAHHRGSARKAVNPSGIADGFRKQVHQSVIKGGLFIGVIVVLIAGIVLRTIQAERRDRALLGMDYFLFSVGK